MASIHGADKFARAPAHYRWIAVYTPPKEMPAAASLLWNCFASNDPNFPLQSSPSEVN
jgi:hypothetical protein